MRKDPRFFHPDEVTFYHTTSMRELFNLLRAHAIFDPAFDSADVVLMQGLWMQRALDHAQENAP